ncbi:hypothetical protein AGR4B_pAt20054 [Agrobacterium tumefaciens str. CFBP 5621]|nr:hypothetical protein AGR4B_pAt20054 [Agrobacterium tumefaciens str. CFBP 5621]
MLRDHENQIEKKAMTISNIEEEHENLALPEDRQKHLCGLRKQTNDGVDHVQRCRGHVHSSTAGKERYFAFAP